MKHISEEDKEFIKIVLQVFTKLAASPLKKGIIQCPKCNANISFVKKKNGHIWANCETENCINFLQ